MSDSEHSDQITKGKGAVKDDTPPPAAAPPGKSFHDDMNDSYERDEQPRGGYGRRRFDRDSSREVCWKWPQGNCTFGDRCRFAHEGPGGFASGGNGPPRGGRGFSRDRGGGGGGGDGVEIFVRGLDYDMTEDDVRDELLGGIRGISNITLPRSRENGDQNRGFAFVKFQSEGDARTAISKLEGIECRGRNIFVRWSEEPSGGDRGDRGGYRGGGGGGGGGYSSNSDICFRWAQSGTCRYGSGCRFSHDNRGGGGGGYGRRGDRGGYRDRRYDSGRGGGRRGGGDDICYSYQRDGSCSYGDSCKFVHE